MSEKIPEQFQRTQLLLGRNAMEKLADAHVIIFGIGGVGGYVAEALVRSGIGHFTLVDNDTVAVSNINRQIIATFDSIGRYKTEVMKERMLSINPKVQVEIRNCFYLPENADEFDFTQYDYVVDAIDTVTAKLQLVMEAKKANIPIISCMGTGNKLDPGCLMITDVYKTSICPLAKVMRRELRKRGIDRLKVLYSTEEPLMPGAADPNESVETDRDAKTEMPQNGRRAVPGSTSFVPSSAGLMIAAEVIKDLTE